MQYILITGSNRGIGLELARQYLQQPDTFIFATCRDPQQATALQQLAQADPNRVHILALDVVDGEAIQEVIQAVSQHAERIDVLINNAAINPKGHQDLRSISRDMMMETLEVNAVAPLMLTKACLPLLKSGAKVVNISSQMGSLTRKQHGSSYAYTTSKAALNMVTRALAGDLRSDGIITVMVHPGWVQTDMGGSGASLTPQESVSELINLIAGLKPEDTGKFFRWDGSVHPW